MGSVALKTGTNIYAWALMTNHAHILLKSGQPGLSAFMRKFLTGYSISYNRRHDRQGHLFRNRYKTIVCEEDAYPLKLVSYIHLNPLRAGLVTTFEELEHYSWSGHASVMGRKAYEWQDADYVLGYFGKRFGYSPMQSRCRCLGFRQQRSAKRYDLPELCKFMFSGTLVARGKLANPDPNDEPAAELLKRILQEKANLESTKKPRSNRSGKTEIVVA